MEKESLNIDEKINSFTQDSILDEYEIGELQKIFDEKKYKQILISKGSLEKLRKIIGSTKNTAYITDSEKILVKNLKQNQPNQINDSSLPHPNTETDTRISQNSWDIPKIPNQNILVNENYDKKIEFSQSDLLNKSIDFWKNLDKNMPQNLKDFLNKYYTNSLVFAWNKTVLKDQSDHWWVLNIWSHKYTAQFIATGVFEWLPKSMNENLRYAIATMAASASMYAKETQDINITKEDIMIPFFYDLWDGNKIFFTYAPGWSISIDFKLSNIEALNNKAGKYLRYINGEIIQNNWDQNHKRDELRVDIWFGIQDGWDAHITSVKNPNDISKYKNGKYDGNQVTIATYTDEILSAKVGNNGESILKWILWIQKDKTGINGIYGIAVENEISTDSGTFWVKWWVIKSKTVGTEVWWSYQLPDNGAKVEVSKTSNYLDSKTHTYTSGIRIAWEVPVWDMSIWATFLDGKWSFDGVQYGEPWKVFWITAWFDTKWWNTPIMGSVKDGLWGADLNLKAQVSTDNNYWISGGINKNTWDLNYGGSIDIWKWNKYGFKETSGSNISGYIEKDIIWLFDIFKDTSINDSEKTKLLLDIKDKYNLEISQDDIKKLGPINSLRAFAIANKDIINNETF